MTNSFQVYGPFTIFCHCFYDMYQVFKSGIICMPFFISGIYLLNNSGHFKTSENVIKQDIGGRRFSFA